MIALRNHRHNLRQQPGSAFIAAFPRQNRTIGQVVHNICMFIGQRIKQPGRIHHPPRTGRRRVRIPHLVPLLIFYNPPFQYSSLFTTSFVDDFSFFSKRQAVSNARNSLISFTFHHFFLSVIFLFSQNARPFQTPVILSYPSFLTSFSG